MMKIDLRIDEKKRKGIALQSKSLLPQKKVDNTVRNSVSIPWEKK